ncbi:MAG: PAS domain S-box protein [Candidatus Omnitrophica bacterium]|nr:PAS domain S-box protein [Candidatus Omnitrophota bacterium]
MRIRLSQKLTLAICFLVIGLMGAATVITDKTTVRAIEEKVRTDLRTAQGLFERFQRMRFEELMAYNHVISSLPYLKAAVSTADLDPATMIHLAEQARENVGSDFLIFTDNKGKILAMVAKRPSLKPENPEKETIIHALTGEDYEGVWATPQGVFLVVASAFKFGDEIVGGLVTGFAVDRHWITSLESMTNAQLAVMGGNVLVSTLSGAPLFINLRKEIESQESVTGNDIFKEEIGNEEFLGISAPFYRSSLRYVLMRSLGHELLFYEQLKFRLITVSLGILLVVLIFTVFYSRKLTEPLEALLEGTKRIARGDFSSRVKAKSHDEIRDLAQAFNQMTDDLKNSREQLIESKEFAENVIRSMIDTLIVLDRDRKITRVNQAACRLLGYQEKELIGQPMSLVGGNDFLAAEGGFEALIFETAISQVEKIYHRKDGKEVPVFLSASAMRNNKHEVEGFVLVAQDMTERKRIEAMAIQSEKMASVGQMFSGIAHEINTPVGVILGFAENLVDKVPEDHVYSKGMKVIFREAKRCKDFIDSLLEFSRKEAPEKTEVNLRQAIESILALVRPEAKGQQVEVVCEFDENPPVIQANYTHIEQIIMNLSKNALDSMPAGGRLTIKTGQKMRARKKYAEISIQDTGSGIPFEIQKKIFDPFFTTKESGKGTGLGLSLIYDLVQRHEGKIELESQMGKGTTFRVLLPF